MHRTCVCAILFLAALSYTEAIGHGTTEAQKRHQVEAPDGNKVADEVLPSSLAQPARDPARAVINQLKIWKAGTTLRVCFVAGTPAALNRIAEVANTWTNFANLRFDFGPPHMCGDGGTYEIKVGFSDTGYWSYIGTDSRRFTPSLNLPGLDDENSSISGREFARLVLHEFGHALGLQHEHQSDDARCSEEIDWPAAEEYYDRCCGWNKDEVRHNLETLVGSKQYRTTRYDRKSIMHYALPVSIFLRGQHSRCYAPENYELSALDRAAIAALYGSQASDQDDRKPGVLAQLDAILKTAGVSEAEIKDTRSKAVTAFFSLYQQTCNPHVANVVGPVTINCIVNISREEFAGGVRQNVETRARAAREGDAQAQGELGLLKRKFADPEEAYIVYKVKGRDYLEQLDIIRDKVRPDLIMDAAQGRNQAPQRVLSALAATNTGAPEVIAYALSLGDLLEAKGDITGARIAYEQARLQAPANGKLLRKYALLLFETGRTAEAVAMLEAVLAKDELEHKLSNADLAWIYDALGEALQGGDKLDAAHDRFTFAKHLAGLGRRDGSLSAADFAWILNDSAGASIRKKDFKKAEESLCRAVVEFRSALGMNHRDTLNAELNLSTLRREMGRWGDARAALESLRTGILSQEAGDPLRGFHPLLLAQTEFHLGHDSSAEALLNDAFAYFDPRHRQSGAHAQRLGRVAHFRALIAFRNLNWVEAVAQARQAKRLFREAYGNNSFDELTVQFWEVLALTEMQDFASAESLMDEFRTGIQRLAVGDKTWTAYAGILEGGIAAEKAAPTGVKTIEEALSTLFASEQVSMGYDVLADGGIHRVLRSMAASMAKVLPTHVRAYREARHARLAVIEQSSSPTANCEGGP